MVWGAVIAGLGSAYLSYRGSQEAGDVAQGASRRAIAEQRRQFNLSRQDLLPFIESAEPAVYQQMGMLGLAEPAVSRLDEQIASLEQRIEGTSPQQGTQFGSEQQQQLEQLRQQREQIGEAEISARDQRRLRELEDQLEAKRQEREDTLRYGGEELVQELGIDDEIQELEFQMQDIEESGQLDPEARRRADELDQQINQLQQQRQQARQAGDDDQLGELRNQLSRLQERRDMLAEAADTPFEASPGYQFRLQEGTQAMQRGQAARGNRLSGRALKEMARYGQGMATQEFQNQFARLGQLAGQGQAAAGTSGQLGAQMAGNVGQLGMQGAGMQANALQNQYGALAQGASDIGEAYYTNQLMNQYNQWMNQPAQ